MKTLFRAVLFFALGAAAFVAVALETDPAYQAPGWPAGPGVTLDESFNALEGQRLFVGLGHWLEGTLSLREIFGEKEDLGPKPPWGYHLPDHPPLGRIWLGFSHELGSSFLGDSDIPLRLTAARFGSAAAFGVLVMIVGFIASKWYGIGAGIIAVISLAVMPRVWGHAHLASLETAMNLTFAMSIFAVAGWWQPSQDTGLSPPPSVRRAMFGGLFWGLAFLTKIQAVFIGPPVVVWALWKWKAKAVLPLAIWGVVGLAVFFAGWPWLWLDPVEHATQYFRSTTDRSALYVWYLGERFADVDVPWHYPWVMILATVPVVSLLLGAVGLLGRCDALVPNSRDSRMQLILVAILVPLVVFSIPGIAVYDGARLFLVVFPFGAIVVGRGAVCFASWLNRQFPGFLCWFFVIGLSLLPGVLTWTMRPICLSRYNVVVGTLPQSGGMDREADYWGESFTRDLWDAVLETVPDGSVVHVSPVVHPLQLSFLQSQIPKLAQRNITLQPCIPEQVNEAKYLLVFFRKADLPPAIADAIRDVPPQTAITRQGLLLGGFYVLPTAPKP